MHRQNKQASDTCTHARGHARAQTYTRTRGNNARTRVYIYKVEAKHGRDTYFSLNPHRGLTLPAFTPAQNLKRRPVQSPGPNPGLCAKRE